MVPGVLVVGLTALAFLAMPGMRSELRLIVGEVIVPGLQWVVAAGKTIASIQFQIKHLLLWTTLIAVLLGLLRWLGPFGIVLLPTLLVFHNLTAIRLGQRVLRFTIVEWLLSTIGLAMVVSLVLWP